MSDPGTWSPTVSTLCKQNKSPVRIAICRGRGVAARPCSLQRPHPLTANGCTQRRKDATDQSPVGHLKWAGGMQVQATTPHSLSRLSIKACEKRDYRPFGLVAPWLILLFNKTLAQPCSPCSLGLHPPDRSKPPVAVTKTQPVLQLLTQLTTRLFHLKVSCSFVAAFQTHRKAKLQFLHSAALDLHAGVFILGE